MSSSSSHCTCCATTIRMSAPLSFMDRVSFMSVIRRFPLLVVALIPLLFMTVIPTVEAVVSSNVLPSCPVLECASSSTPAPKTFFPVHVASDVAQYWDSFYGTNFKIINATGSGEQYVLYQCGTPRPSVGSVTVLSADYQNDGGIVERTQTVEILPNAKFFSIPLKKVCISETVSLTFFELLGVRTSIHKLVPALVTSACINQLVSENRIQSLPWSPKAEDLATCDAVINFGNFASPDPKTITFVSTADPGVLNRAEYLDYLALFFNKEEAANSVFVPIQKRYIALAEKAKAKPNKKKAAWTNQYQGFYVDNAAYKVELAISAGMDVYAPTGPVTKHQSPAGLLKELLDNNVEVIIDETYGIKDFDAFVTKFGINGTADADPATSSYSFIKNKMVLRNDGRKGKNDAHDWFESAVPNMDAVLADLVYRSFPDLVAPNYARRWFRNIALGEGTQIILDECTDVNAATLPLLDETPGPAGYKCPAWLMDPSVYVNNTVPPKTSAAIHQHTAFIPAMIVMIAAMIQLFVH